MEIKVERLISNKEIKKDQAVVIESGRISSIRPLENLETPEYSIMVPGFVDIHTHGRKNLSTMDTHGDNYSKLSKSYLESGTTTYIASLLTAPVDEITGILEYGTEYMIANQYESRMGSCATLHGFHLEGPYLSVKNCGAQHPDLIIPFGQEGIQLLENYHEIIKMITLDYEQPSSNKLVALAKGYSILLALGHDETIGKRVYEAFEEGVSLVTHIFCSNSSMFRGVRDGVFTKLLGTQEIALMARGVSVEVIPDNYHISSSIFDFIRHNKPTKEIIAVSDSTPYSGIPYESGKRCKLGAVDIMLNDGVAMLPDRSSLAGSIITLHDAFKIMAGSWGEPLCDVVAFTSYNPANKLGLSKHIGSIKKGLCADIVLMDDKYNLMDVYKSGIKYNFER